MPSLLEALRVGRCGRAFKCGVALAGLSVCVGTTGCLSAWNRQAVAVAAATAPVIDEADAAYRGAQRLHDLKVDAAVVEAFEKTPTVDRGSIVEFPSDEAIAARLTVLEAFKCYVETVVELTEGTRSPQLEAASKSVGTSLTSLGNRFAPTVEDALHLAPPTSSTTTTYTTGDKSTTTTATVAAPLIPASGQNAVSTAALALGQFLVSRKVKKELPGKIKAMDPVVETLCKVLEDDVEILQKQERRDFEAISDSQTLFLGSPAGAKLDGEQRRVQIARLPEMVRQQRGTDEQLTKLKGSIVRLYLTHHALAAAAQNNNPSSLKANLGDLAAAGSDLGKFYSSLPSK